MKNVSLYFMQENDLQKVFLFSLQMLSEIEKQPSPLPRETQAVLNRILGITEQVLCWDFTPKFSMSILLTKLKKGYWVYWHPS